ncbi:MAG: DUF2335 domain-containing protein [Candidatus Electrothrix sp. EH2]|nr:DUF2335 domain-containing protein [Candidatus Electrothrix sp. EH2]
MSGNNQEQEVSRDKEHSELQEVLKEIPDKILVGELENRIRQETGLVQAASQTMFSGPIPPPTMLREYDAVQEGFADRIISMTEAQQTHRHELETKSVDAAIAMEKRGHL